MTRSQLHTYKECLEAQRIGLLRSLQETRGGVPNRNGESMHSTQDPTERDAALQSLMRESRLLWIVESALQGIADGMYGKCLFCQRGIPARQLAAVPWSAYCGSCQKLAEAYVNRPVGPLKS